MPTFAKARPNAGLGRAGRDKRAWKMLLDEYLLSPRSKLAPQNALNHRRTQRAAARIDTGAEPLSDHAAHRQSAPIHFADAQCIDHCEHVAAKPLHRIGSLRHARLAVTAPVVTHQPEVAAPGRHLVVHMCRLVPSE